MSVRIDVHRPSAIQTEDYEFVANEFLKVEDLGTALFLKAEREKIKEHMARTGGTYSQHAHGGNCMVCGSVNAIYTLLFYHSKTNSYVRMGSDCADKVYAGVDFGQNRFRARVENAREALAGKRKAQALLGDAGVSEAWGIYESEMKPEWGADHGVIRNIVMKLVKYGSVSPAQVNYIKILLKRIADKPALDAKRAEEKAAAADVPEGRIQITGKVLTTKTVDTYYGPTLKMLVQHESGYKVWGTVPRSLVVDRGDTVNFTAMVERSKDDSKFGFFKRPTNATVVEQVAMAA